MSWTKQKWGKRNSNSVVDTQTWKNKWLAKGWTFYTLWWLLISTLAFSLQQSVVLVPILYSLKTKPKRNKQTKKPDTESANEHEILRATPPSPPQPPWPRRVGLSLWRIQSLPGNRTLWRTISAMMHPTDQMSTTKHQVVKKQPESLASLFLNHLPNTGSPSKHSSGGTSVKS